ncbi:hypothetical protein [Polaromonas sp.]|uniref:hypothetical protein n=1 Tax=Polaromonas sp. TaxID=1869339 RepID=UPI003564CE95
MPDPIAPALATIVGAGVALPILVTAPALVPQLVVFGVALGLRADVLVAGFFGALVAIVLLDTVPSSGDTWRELVRTTWRRMWHALASSLAAGYLTPLFMLLEGQNLRIPEALMLSMAFVIGAGAQGYLRKVLKAKEARLAALAGKDGGPDAAA